MVAVEASVVLPEGQEILCLAVYLLSSLSCLVCLLICILLGSSDNIGERYPQFPYRQDSSDNSLTNLYEPESQYLIPQQQQQEIIQRVSTY